MAPRSRTPKLLASPAELAAQEAEDRTPDLPPAPVLAALVFELTQDAAIGESGRARHDLGGDLRLDARRVDSRVMVVLSRPDAPPGPDEVTAVAQATGWSAWEQERVVHGGRHWVKLTRRAPDPPPPAAPEIPATDEDPDDAAIRALLLSPGPWHNRLLTPQMAEGRAAAVAEMKRPDLRWELAWARRRWRLEVDRALVRAALVNAIPAPSPAESAMLPANPEVNRER